MGVPNRALIFEFQTLGQWTRVAVIDEISGEEVVVSAPSQATRSDMMQLGRGRMMAHLRKLGRIPSDSDDTGPNDGRGGIVV
jgi:hypothetical protein